MSLSAGTRLGCYEILLVLGAGGMGEVYRARDLRLGRDVAIKILVSHAAADPGRLARFEREARALASLNHPGGRGTGTGLPTPECLADARQIADALDVAHERGIVHRDLKPANIALTPTVSPKCLILAGESNGFRPPQRGRARDHALYRSHARRDRARYCGVHHESRAGVGSGCRQADRYLGVRLCRLRDAYGPCTFNGPTVSELSLFVDLLSDARSPYCFSWYGEALSQQT